MAGTHLGLADEDRSVILLSLITTIDRGMETLDPRRSLCTRRWSPAEGETIGESEKSRASRAR